VSSVRTYPIPAAQREPTRAGPAAPASWRGGCCWPLRPGWRTVLGAWFGLLPSPPPLTATLAALTQYAASHHHFLLAAARLEAPARCWK